MRVEGAAVVVCHHHRSIDTLKAIWVVRVVVGSCYVANLAHGSGSVSE